MTYLPSAGRAVVDRAKIRDYLLNPHNVQNGGKAALFLQFGFARESWEQLAATVAAHPIDNTIDAEVLSPHGHKFVVRCNMRTPDGRNPCCTTVWIVDLGTAVPRFVTAY